VKGTDINNTIVTKRTERLKQHVRNLIKKAKLNHITSRKGSTFVVRAAVLNEAFSNPNYGPRLIQAGTSQEFQSILAEFCSERGYVFLKLKES
jgi:hypothetical protein